MMKYLISFSLLTTFLCGYSQNLKSEGGELVLAENSPTSFILNVATGKADLQQVTVEGQSFKNAVKIHTKAAPVNMWDIQYSAPSKMPVETGDVLLLSFYARMIETKDETGLGSLGCVFEKATPDYDKSLYRVITVDSEWRQYFFPFKMQQSFRANEAQLNFQFGTQKEQIIELAQIELLNYRKNKSEADLPKTNYSYVGRDLDAPWRKLAEANIDKYRKANIVFLVQDKKGNPVEGLAIKVEMIRHSFGWGTCIDANTFLTNPTYKTNFYRNFNKAVFENDLKWPEWNNLSNRNKTFTVLQELTNKKVAVRGHCLVWPSWKWLPAELKKSESDPVLLQNQILGHIKDESSSLGSKVSEWDVFNEPYTNTDIQKICGDTVMASWFLETKKHSPTTKLYINDFSILSGGGNDVQHQDHYYKTIDTLLKQGAPIEGIGFQGHFSWALTPPEKVWKILDRFAKFGLAMQITEFDVDIDDEILQADYTRDFMTTIFSYPQIMGFMIWGFWEGRHWKPNAAMYSRNWAEKQNLKVWQELIYKTWWTNENLRSNEEGKVVLRGFLGDYKYTITNKRGEIVTTGEFTLDEKGKLFQLLLK